MMIPNHKDKKQPSDNLLCKMTKDNKRIKKQPTDDILSKMIIVINYTHFHRAIYGGSYTQILNALSTKSNIPCVLEENPDSMQ